MYADVTFLIGLGFLDKYRMCVNNAQNRLVGEELVMKFLILRKRYHKFLEWSIYGRMLYMRNELVELYRNFSHPALDNLLNLARLKNPWEVRENSKDMVDIIVKPRDPCESIHSGPVRFRVSITGETEMVFEEELSLNFKFSWWNSCATRSRYCHVILCRHLA